MSSLKEGSSTQHGAKAALIYYYNKILKMDVEIDSIKIDPIRKKDKKYYSYS